MTATAPSRATPPPRARRNLAEWVRSIGDIPLERILLDPPPGTVSCEHYVSIDGRVNDRLVELVDNTLVEKPMGRLESEIAAIVISLLRAFIKQNNLGGKLSGEAGMLRMRDRNIRMPDIAWTAPQDVRDPDRKQAAPQEPPTLAIEIISESNTEIEMDHKLGEYFESGCRMAWLLYPQTKTLRVYESPQKFHQLTADDTLEGGDVLLGFSVRVGDFFDV